MGKVSQDTINSIRRIKERRAARERTELDPGLAPGVQEALGVGGAGLRYIDRAARLAGLGVGTVVGGALNQFLDPFDKTFVGQWLPDLEDVPGAFQEFNRMRQQGDWDAAIEAYQDELDAGPGFWGASEVASSFIPTGGPFLAGGKLLGVAPGLAKTIAGVAPRIARPGVEAGIRGGLTGTGKVLRVPWQAEEAVGRGALKGLGWAGRGIGAAARPVVGPVVRPIVSRFRGRGPGGVAEEALEEVPVGGLTPEDVVDADAILGAPTTATRVTRAVPSEWREAKAELARLRQADADEIAARAGRGERTPWLHQPLASLREEELIASARNQRTQAAQETYERMGSHAGEPASLDAAGRAGDDVLQQFQEVTGIDVAFLRNPRHARQAPTTPRVTPDVPAARGVVGEELIPGTGVTSDTILPYLSKPLKEYSDAQLERMVWSKAGGPELRRKIKTMSPGRRFYEAELAKRKGLATDVPGVPAQRVRSVGDLDEELEALRYELDEVQVEKSVLQETRFPKPPKFCTRERAEYDALRKRQSEAGIPIRSKKAMLDKFRADEQRLKQEMERVNKELDAAFAKPPEGMAEEGVTQIPRTRQPEFALDDIVPDDQARDYIKASGPSGPSGGGPPPGGSSAAENIFEEIRRVATPGETQVETLLRRHEGAVTVAQNEASRLVRAGEKALHTLGLSVSRYGREIIKDSAIPEIDSLFRALHDKGSTVPARLQGVYDELRTLTDWNEASRLNFDPNMATVDDYFYRGWKPPDDLIEEVGRQGGMGWPPKFKKPRRNATYSDMRDLGYEPLSWNPFEQWHISRLQTIRHEQQMTLLSKMKQAGIAKTSGGGPGVKGWRVPEVGPAFEGTPLSYIDDAGEAVPYMSKSWAVPEDAARRLENIYGKKPSLGKIGIPKGIPKLGGRDVDLMKVIDWITFIPKRAKLMVSFFQQQDFLTRSLIGTWTQMVDQLFFQRKPIAALQTLAKWPESAYSLLRANLSPDYRQLLKKQLTSTTELIPGRPGIHLKGMMEAGLSIRDASIFPIGLDDLARSVAEEGRFLGVKRVMGLVGQIESATRRGLFDGVYPAAQIADIQNNMVHVLVRKFPKASDEAINGMVARMVNLKYSTIPASQSMFQNQTVRAFLQRVFFSVGESEGLLRQGVQAFKGPYASTWRKHWLAAYLSLISTANVIHALSTGKPLPADRYVPISKGNWGWLPFGYNRDFAAPTIPIEGRSGTELTLDIVGQMDTVLRLTDPGQFISSRESVPVRAFVNQWKGTDYFGAPIDEVGPGGIASRTAALAIDMFAPIGPGQAAVDIARDRIPLVEELLPPGEERVGLAGQLLGAPGFNIRAETTGNLLSRMARESGEVVQLSTHPRFGQPVREWDEMTKPQQQRVVEESGIDEELTWRTEVGAIRGTEGSVLRQKRTELEDETAGVMEKVAEQYLRMPRETGEFIAADARNAIGKALSEHYLKLEAIHVDLDEDEEPEENTLRHHTWRYRQIFAEFGEDGPSTDEDWEDFNKAVAKFWRNTPEEDVGLVLGEMRQLELKFPEEIRTVLEAKRYASALKMDINGIRYSYWDLDTIPEVEKEILNKSWTNLGSYDVTIADVRDYIQKSSAARSAGKITSRGKAIDKAFRASNTKGGMLFEVKKSFEEQAPEEWMAAMLDSGYYFKSRGWVWEALGKYLREGYEWGPYSYKKLYEEALIENR